MDLIGKVIGNRYEIIEKIGNGGMATVYKAKCNVLNRFVAIKVLKEEYITDTDFINRFNIEAQAAASLSHPNIVSIYDVGNDNDIYYIVMELVQGKTIKEIINEEGALSWKWTLNVASQIASALEVAHKNGIIHRDIKPHNIIITEDGIAKVTDFGIAKAVSNSTITSFGATIGSVHYFSPEQAKGSYTDAKSDIYSLGVVLYEMVTGMVPFEADTPVSIALKHMQEKAKDPKNIKPDLPDSVSKIIMKAMEKEASLRYLSAEDMLVDLKKVMQDPDINIDEIQKEHIDEPTQRIDLSKEDINKENKEKKVKMKFWKRKWFKFLIGLLVCIGVFVGAMFFGLNLLSKDKTKEVQIPDLVGMLFEEAEVKLNSLGIKYDVIEEFSPDGKEARNNT